MGKRRALKRLLKTEGFLETGKFKNGMPYAKIGTKPEIIVYVGGLSFQNKIPKGFELKQFIKHIYPITANYTIYGIARTPNPPEDYGFTNMAKDYAEVIKAEFRKPVHVMGISTGGQLIQYLAADHPELINKLIIISAAYRLNKNGKRIERETGELIKQKKYGKAMAKIMEFVFQSKISLFLMKLIMQIFGGYLLGKIKYPNDALSELKADRDMDFKERLNEIKAPTLVLSGEDDAGYSMEDVRRTTDGILNAKLKLYKGYGHNLTFKNMDEVLKDMQAFLKE